MTFPNMADFLASDHLVNDGEQLARVALSLAARGTGELNDLTLQMRALNILRVVSPDAEEYELTWAVDEAFQALRLEITTPGDCQLLSAIQ